MSSTDERAKRSFRSDNNAGLCPEALRAITSCAAGHAVGYGGDEWTTRAEARFRDLFGEDSRVFFVATGTIANNLAIAAMTEPWQRVLCHSNSHWNDDESTAPELFTRCRTTTIESQSSKLTVDDPTRLTGSGSTPSLGVSTAGVDRAEIADHIRDHADVTLDPSYSSATWGDAGTGTWLRLHRNGDLMLDGTVQGAGILVVTGNARIDGSFHFDGVVLVFGNLDFGTVPGGEDDDEGPSTDIRITGALIKGEGGNVINFDDDVQVRYSSEALAGIGSLLPAPTTRYTVVTGWQEIAR